MALSDTDRTKALAKVKLLVDDGDAAGVLIDMASELYDRTRDAGEMDAVEILAMALHGVGATGTPSFEAKVQRARKLRLEAAGE